MADGFFGTVRHIGEIKVLGGNRVLLGLPQTVLSRIPDGVNEIVQEAIGSALGKSCQVRFVEKGTLAEQVAEPFVAEKPQPDKVSTVAEPEIARTQAFMDKEAGVGEEDGRDTLDPYQEAVSDPVVQDLVSRGGQVTDVQLLTEDE
jgi:hypothetical protein